MELKLEDFDKIILLQKDYLLMKRMLYKTKSQYRRQKQFQLLKKLTKLIKQNFRFELPLKKRKSKEDNEKKIFRYEAAISKNDLDFCIDLILKLGELFKEMLKIKLYPSYSLIFLGILSREYFLLNYFKNLIK